MSTHFPTPAILMRPSLITVSHVSTTTSAGTINIVDVPVQGGDLMIAHGGIYDDRTGGFYFTSAFSANFGFTTAANAVDNDQSGSDYRSIASSVAYKIIADGDTTQTVAFFGGYGVADNITIIAQVFRPSRAIKDATVIGDCNASVTGDANTSLNFADGINKGDCLVWAGSAYTVGATGNHFFSNDQFPAPNNKTRHDLDGWDNLSDYVISNNDTDVTDTTSVSNPSVTTEKEAATNIAIRLR